MAPLLLVALVAAQAGDALQFDWRAPPQCPDQATVRARLGAGLVGTANASVNQLPDGFHLELEVDGATRELAATTCEEAADAAVIIIRLALAPKAAPVPAAAPPVAVEARSTAGPSWGVRVAALAATDLLWLPRPVARFGAAVQVSRGALEAVVEGTTSTTLTFPGGPTPTAAVAVRVPFALELGACWAFEAGPFRGGPCVTGGPTWLAAQGLNVSDPKQSTAVLWSAGPAARGAIRLGSRFDLGASAGVRFGGRPQVSFEGWPAVVTGGAAAVALSATLGVRF